MGSSLLDHDLHQLSDQLLEDDLTRDGPRCLDHGEQVELFRCGCDRGRSLGWRVREMLRVEALELPDLAVCTPPGVAISRFPQIGVREELQTLVAIKPRRGFARDGFVLHESALPRGLHGLFVEPHGISVARFQTSDFRSDERMSAREIVGAAR